MRLYSGTKREKRREATRETNSTQRTVAGKSSQGADEITATHTATEPKDLTEQLSNSSSKCRHKRKRMRWGGKKSRGK